MHLQFHTIYLYLYIYFSHALHGSLACRLCESDQKGSHLPYCYHIDRNYKTMERECQERGEKQVCMSRFYEIWHEKIPDVKVNTFVRFGWCEHQ